MNYLELFKPQIADLPPSTGDLLADKNLTLESLVQQYVLNNSIFGASPSVEQATAAVQRLLNEYKQHAGHHKVFALINDPVASRSSVLALWTDELELLDQYDHTPGDGDRFPSFTKRQ